MDINHIKICSMLPGPNSYPKYFYVDKGVFQTCPNAEDLK